MDSILKQLEDIGITSDEVQAGIKYSQEVLDEYNENITDMNNMLDILHKSKKNKLISFGTDEQVEKQIKDLTEQRDKYLSENEINIIQLESYLNKLKILNEIL